MNIIKDKVEVSWEVLKQHNSTKKLTYRVATLMNIKGNNLKPQKASFLYQVFKTPSTKMYIEKHNQFLFQWKDRLKEQSNHYNLISFKKLELKLKHHKSLNFGKTSSSLNFDPLANSLESWFSSWDHRKDF